MRESWRAMSAGFLLPLAAARSLRIAVLLSVATAGIVAAVHALGYLTTDSLEAFRRAIPVVAVPIGAALLAELPIRDGLTQRTLLYPLFGPCSRSTLAIGRTLWTAVLVLAGSLLASGALRWLTPADGWDRECLAIALGSLAYVSVFGLLHLVSKRGLVSALALYFLVDQPLSQLPFTIRALAPSFHIGTVLGRVPSFPIPLDVDPVRSTPSVSALVLLALSVLATAWTARLFARRDLPELCG